MNWKAPLSVGDALDMRVVHSAAGLENTRLLDVDPRRVDPTCWLPLDAIYPFAIRSVADFNTALISRLAAIPRHLENARDYLIPRAGRIPRLWLDSTVVSARDGVGFLPALSQMPKVSQGGLAPESLSTSIETAVKAVQGFADFLERDLAKEAKGEVACGQAYFEHQLRARHFLDASVDEIYRFGETLAGRTRSELRAVCRELTGSEETGAILKPDTCRPPAVRRTAGGLPGGHERGAGICSCPLAGHCPGRGTTRRGRHPRVSAEPDSVCGLLRSRARRPRPAGVLLRDPARQRSGAGGA